MPAKRTNLTIPASLYDAAQRVMALRSYDSFSEYVADLIRDDAEARNQLQPPQPPLVPSKRDTNLLNDDEVIDVAATGTPVPPVLEVGKALLRESRRAPGSRTPNKRS